MKYAVISDIHGNLSALKAVINDAKLMGCDIFLFLGDYHGELNRPNDVVNLIRTLKNAYVVRGNKEDYFKLYEQSFSSQRQIISRSEQFTPLYWSYDNITSENRDFLSNLKEKLTVKTANGNIYLAHSDVLHFGETRATTFNIHEFTPKFKHYTRAQYNEYVQKALLSDADFIKTLESMPDGVYVFGHSHLQWHARFDGKLLINAGSCGLPNDTDTRVPYTVLEYSDNNWLVIERRVEYSISEVIEDYRKSSLYGKSHVWDEITMCALKYGLSYLAFFLKFLNKYSNYTGDTSFPFAYSDELWREAYDKWRESPVMTELLT